MSWHYSRALEAEYSAATCSAGDACAPLKSMTMQGACSSPDKTTDACPPSQSGTTLQHSTADHGADLLTWYLAASRAKTSASPEKALASPAPVQGYGLTWPASSAKFDRDTASWKIHPCLFLEDSMSCSIVLPRWGTMRAGELSAQDTPAHLISGTGSGLWLGTPTATMSRRSSEFAEGCTPMPAEFVKMWPTPCAMDSNPIQGGNLYETKTGTVRHMREDGRSSNRGLSAQVMWPTPTGPDAKNNGAPSQMVRNTKPLNAEVGGSLNPTWVEILMGWPENWSCLNPISHVKYIQWLMEFCDNEKTRTSQALRVLRQGNVQEEIRQQTGRLVGLHEAAILLSLVCEHKNRPDQARIFVACAEVLEVEMRGVRASSPASSAPSKSGHSGQLAGEYPDLVQALPRFLAHYGKEAWQDGSWENAVPRVAQAVASRVHRLKAIGNGQVPAVAALAWRTLA